jgi:hypothetical protein
MGKVTNMQNGQHGPAIMIGDPSARSHRTNIFPNLRAQQQKNRLKSRIGPFSATSRSHRVDTAYLFFIENKERKTNKTNIIARHCPHHKQKAKGKKKKAKRQRCYGC